MRDIEHWFSSRRARECGDKIRHPDESSANQEARLMSLQTGEVFSAYQCSFCHRWHIGRSA